MEFQRSSKWNVEDERILINFHKENRVLWDPKHPEYFNKTIRYMKLKELSNILGQNIRKEVTSENCKRKWKNLRSTYSRELRKCRKLPSGSSSSAVYISRWCHFKEMQFLNDVNADESTDSLDCTSPQEIIEIQIQDEKTTSNMREAVSEVSDVSPTLSSEESPPAAIPSGNNVKRLQSEVLNSAKDIMRDILARRSQTKDSISVFSEFVEANLRAMPFVHQQAVMIEIHKILANHLTTNEDI